MNGAVRNPDEMVRVGLWLNVFVCNALVNGYCKQGQVGEAERVFRGMVDC
ncbi:hypothetical protein Fmac_020860 [Flemingia macrophylla]|uniref:Pentatricopeptide repeat-containing protein n=1 Tax=Flemingia macrophylla TaxID=520843 RepID=A0ABD1LV69_9FABA